MGRVGGHLSWFLAQFSNPSTAEAGLTWNHFEYNTNYAYQCARNATKSEVEFIKSDYEHVRWSKAQRIFNVRSLMRMNKHMQNMHACFQACVVYALKHIIHSCTHTQGPLEGQTLCLLFCTSQTSVQGHARVRAHTRQAPNRISQ